MISTAGAVLRLEVLHYNMLTNSRGKDQVLGIVEIPLSDLPNANLRRPDGVEIETADGKRRSMTFDGYCDRWYRLVPSDQLDSKSIVLSKPIVSPELRTSNGSSRKVGMQSLEEVGKRIQALTIVPVEWFASAIKLDLPARRPEAICQEHKERSMIHVQIKLNASICGDVLSHAWFPPVRPRPVPPPYDPEILLSRILHVGKQTEPYRKNIIQYIEFCIKWKHPPKVCVRYVPLLLLLLLLSLLFVQLCHGNVSDYNISNAKSFLTSLSHSLKGLYRLCPSPRHLSTSSSFVPSLSFHFLSETTSSNADRMQRRRIAIASSL